MAPSHPTRGPRRTGPALLLLLGACAAAGPPGMTGDAYASLQQALRTDPGARPPSPGGAPRDARRSPRPPAS